MAVGGWEYRKPERLRGGCGSVVDWVQNPKPERRFLAFCRRCLVLVVGLCACDYWWSVWKPKTLCGERGALYHFGELVRLSGIGSFRGGLLHIGKPLPLFAVVVLG